MKKGNVDTERKRDKQFIEKTKELVTDLDSKNALSTGELAKQIAEEDGDIKPSSIRSKLTGIRKILEEQEWPLNTYKEKEGQGLPTIYHYDARTDEV